MDGYIKNQLLAIRSLRIAMAWKYATTFLILIFIPVWLFGLAVDVPPKEWIHTEVVYSHVSYEQIGLRRFKDHVLITQEGKRFMIGQQDGSAELLEEQLIPGQVCSIVYSTTIAGGNQMEALSHGDMIYRDLDTSIARWRDQRQWLIYAILVTLAVEAVALLLIDRLWCREEHNQIKVLQGKITRRKKLRSMN